MAHEKMQQTWDTMAANYQRKYSNSIMFYEEKIHLKIFGCIQNKSMLDLGCGGGQTAIFFAQHGAIVTGLDFSIEQLEFAKNSAKQNNAAISFVHNNIENLACFDNATFDLINSSHALHYVANLQQSFNEMFRVLKPKGKLVISVSHPFNHILETDGDQLIVKRSYLKPKQYKFAWQYIEDNSSYTMHIFIRKISDYVMALIQAGFVISHMFEPETILAENSPWCDDANNHEELVPGALIIGAYIPKANQF